MIRVMIVNEDNSYIVKKVKNPNKSFDVNGETYLLEQPYVLRKKSLIGSKDYIIYSKSLIFPTMNPNKTTANDVIKKVIKLDSSNTVKNETTIADKEFQILLHQKITRDLLGEIKDSFLTYIMMAGAGILVGLLIGLAMGHVRL